VRKRTIDPLFFSHEALAECSFGARLLFIGLWCIADREGRLEDRPKHIKLLVFPADDVDVLPLLRELATVHLIARYEVDGRRFMVIPGFARNQRPNIREAASVTPEPPSEISFHMHARESTDMHVLSRARTAETESYTDSPAKDSESLDHSVTESVAHVTLESVTLKPSVTTELVQQNGVSSDTPVGWYVDACRELGVEPGNRTKPRLGAEAKKLLDSGRAREHVKAAVRELARRNASPVLLETIVGDVERAANAVPMGRIIPPPLRAEQTPEQRHHDLLERTRRIAEENPL
jgi:hypothetical protein